MATTTARTITVLDPTAPPRELRRPLAARLPDLRGRAVGFLWNSKPNGDVLFARLEELLRERYETSRALHRRKATVSIPAPREVLEELAAQTHAVVVGLGD